jgi:PAS domain S-box-containing protein
MSKKRFFDKFSVLPASSWFDFFINHFKKIVGIAMIILLGIILFLGWMSAKKIREVVVEDFNKQQLVISRHVAGQIENSLYNLKRELMFLSLSPSVQYSDIPFMDKQMDRAFLKLKDEGVLEIRFVEEIKHFSSQGIRTHILNNQGYKSIPSYPEDIDYLNLAKQVEKDKIFISDVYHADSDSNNQRLILKIVVPVRQVSSIDNRHPIETNKFSGALLFAVDASVLIQKITKGLRSGETGYAWVIDNKGIFLYHPEEEFIGKSAFEARKDKKPTISFARINEIQKEMMLKGKEGTSWYISGWHRGIEGEIKKLIAYTPIMLDKDDAARIWSVAVVAPITEVESIIRSIQIRQFLLEGVVIFAILFGGLLIIGIMLRWSASLSEEVAKKTNELKKSEERYRSLIENANDIIFTVDRDGNITSINLSGYSFFKRQKEDIIGVNLGELCFNEDSAALQLKVIEEVFDSQISDQITYPVNIHGEEYWLSTNFSPLVDETGHAIAVLGIARDISLIKKKEEEAQMYHAEKLASIGTLAAGVAHEINNPLAVILGFTDLLLEKEAADSEKYDVLKTIEKQALNAKRVVQNLLSFARHSEYKEEYIDINKSLQTVLAVVKNILLVNKISLNQQLEENLPKVKADAGEIEQVFLNIINNAIHAMKGGGILKVVTETQGGAVKISFSDTGTGIKKEHRTKIFDPLFTTKKVGEGTGLGLSVSYGIITKHGGAITFETKTAEESSRTGTTFIITLPTVRKSE